MRSVVVYCASSDDVGEIYIESARVLGQILAQNGIRVINGGGSTGLMGALNSSVLGNNGIAVGVIPSFMVESGWCHAELAEVIVTNTMHERKSIMADMSDAAIALPGGIGTVEELAEILTWRQLGLYKKPIFSRP